MSEPIADAAPTPDDTTTPGRAKKPRPRWRFLAGFLWLGVLAGAGVALTALLWHDDLSTRSRGGLAVALVGFMACTFAYHAGLAMLLPLGFAALTRRRGMVLASAGVMMLGAGPELTGMMHRGPDVAQGAGIVVMSANLMYGRMDAEAVLAMVRRERPEVLLLQEWTPEASGRLGAELRAILPHVYEHTRQDAFGQAIFSRRPFLTEPRAFPPIAGFGEPQISAEIDVDGRAMRLVNVHLLPPVNLRMFSDQRWCAGLLGEWASGRARAEPPHVFMGDFNAVARSPVIGAIRAAGFREAHQLAGSWRGSTWPRRGMLRHSPGIRIDHALIHPDIALIEARTSEDFGSDHRAVIVRVGWRPDPSISVAP